ncbi:MAG: hypothetical protein J7623_19225 [Chitinophaga sp.]|uniref:hypothetical protein n=1 Tax=Chitinophaga sp. TaxID=1869181 RepID=UPI001B207D07|nr:hypothetical protein [Chitinophaga sp.]MBO9730781.1 hypothetical protein [Chitinophaga sp.]
MEQKHRLLTERSLFQVRERVARPPVQSSRAGSNTALPNLRGQAALPPSSLRRRVAKLPVNLRSANEGLVKRENRIG